VISELGDTGFDDAYGKMGTDFVAVEVGDSVEMGARVGRCLIMRIWLRLVLGLEKAEERSVSSW